MKYRTLRIVLLFVYAFILTACLPEPTSSGAPKWINSAVVKYVWPQVPNDKVCPFTAPEKSNHFTVGYTHLEFHSEPFSLGIEYSDSPNSFGSVGVGCMGGYDVQEYQFLEFWVKGSAIGESFHVKLKDMNGSEDEVAVSVDSDGWHKITIPLTEYSDVVDLSNLENFSLGFNETFGAVKIYVDDFAFVGQ